MAYQNGSAASVLAPLPAPPEAPYVRLIPLGGCGEIGRNMTLIETNDDIVAVDCGLMFPDDEMFGVDIVINDFTYLRDRADKFRALLAHARSRRSHRRRSVSVARVRRARGGDAAHAGAGAREDARRQTARPQVRHRKPGDRVTYGGIETEFIHTNHSVAGTCALAIRTPVGTIFHTGDFKFDQTPIDGAPADFASMARVGREGVLCMLSDSTNAERPGTRRPSAWWAKRSPTSSPARRAE